MFPIFLERKVYRSNRSNSPSFSIGGSEMLSSQGSEENDTSSDESGSTVELEVATSPPRFGMRLRSRTVPATQTSSTKDSQGQKHWN